MAVVLVPFALAPVDFAFAEVFFEADGLVPIAFEALDLAAVAFAVPAFAVPAFAVDFADDADDADDADLAERARFRLSPPGNALPTAFIASVAKSPTDPAILPAVLPTLLTTLPASGIGCSPFRRPSNGRSSPCCADVVPLGGRSVRSW